MSENQVLDDYTARTPGGGGLQITGESREFLRVAAYWSGFLAIVGFVFLGLGALAFLFMGSLMGMYTEALGLGGSVGAAPGIFSGLFGLLFLALYAVPIWYLYQFSQKTKAALRNDDTAALTEALRFLARHYKFFGILMIVILAIYAVAIVMMIGLASAMG